MDVTDAKPKDFFQSVEYSFFHILRKIIYLIEKYEYDVNIIFTGGGSNEKIIYNFFVYHLSPHFNLWDECTEFWF